MGVTTVRDTAGRAPGGRRPQWDGEVWLWACCLPLEGSRRGCRRTQRLQGLYSGVRSWLPNSRAVWLAPRADKLEPAYRAVRSHKQAIPAEHTARAWHGVNA